MKTKIIPFDLEIAKKIQAGEIKGRIVTNHGMVVTLVDAQYGFDEEYWIPIIWHWPTEHDELVLYNSKGECKNSHNNCYLHIELPEEQVDGSTNNDWYKAEDVRVKIEYVASKMGITYEQFITLMNSIKGISANNKKVIKTLEDMKGALQRICEKSKQEFEPFDKVLVTQNGWHYWIPSLYRNETPDGKHICIDNLEYDKCIPYEGNQELVGTTDKPKEE